MHLEPLLNIAVTDPARHRARAKRFTLSQKLGGGRERAVASVSKESRFSSATAFLMAAMTNADKYIVHIGGLCAARRQAAGARGAGRSGRDD
jgi:hypothetical protein